AALHRHTPGRAGLPRARSCRSAQGLRRGRRRFEERLRLVVGLEQSLHLLPQRIVAAATRREKRRPLGRRQRQRLLKQRIDPLPALDLVVSDGGGGEGERGSGGKGEGE